MRSTKLRTGFGIQLKPTPGKYIVCDLTTNERVFCSSAYSFKLTCYPNTHLIFCIAYSGVGDLRSAYGFHFLRVFQAGHMVPRDQPENALAMINTFLNGKL